MDPFDSLRGRYSLQTASEVKSDLIFEICDPNYLLIHVHIAYMVWDFLAASEASKHSQIRGHIFKFEISDFASKRPCELNATETVNAPGSPPLRNPSLRSVGER